MSDRPLALDLCSGLGGWSDGLEAEGWDVIRVDIADMFAQMGTPKPPTCLLVIADILAFHGSQASGCRLIVASPPCTEYSWMAMPWSRAKRVARALRGEDEFPTSYRGSRTIEQLNALFDACFRIQREACEAAGRHIPLVVENVRGAQPWVGRARWNFGSYYLWGDVPALMPFTFKAVKVGGITFNGYGTPGYKPVAFNGTAQRRLADDVKIGGGANVPGIGWTGFADTGASWRNRECMGVKGVPHRTKGHWTNPAEHEGVKNGNDWFSSGDGCSLQRKHGSISTARKAASALIAKIPLPLSRHIARTYAPVRRARAAGGGGG